MCIRDSFLVAHDAATYAETATLVDGSTDRSVLRWRESMAEFFDPSDQHTTPVSYTHLDVYKRQRCACW